MLHIAQAPSPASPSFDLEAIPGVVERARASFDARTTRPLAWRLAQLKALRRMVTENEDAIHRALTADLGRPRMESYVAEIAFTVKDIDHAAAHLRSWMKPSRVSTCA